MLNQNNHGFMHSPRGSMLKLTPGIVEEGWEQYGEHWLVCVGQKMPGIITRFEPRPIGEGDMAVWHAWSRQIFLVSQATSLLIVAWNSSARCWGHKLGLPKFSSELMHRT